MTQAVYKNQYVLIGLVVVLLWAGLFCTERQTAYNYVGFLSSECKSATSLIVFPVQNQRFSWSLVLLFGLAVFAVVGVLGIVLKNKKYLLSQSKLGVWYIWQSIIYKLFSYIVKEFSQGILHPQLYN